MTLKEKRILFTALVPRLINEMLAKGFKPMIGRDGLPHKKDSLHFDGLAVDVDLCDSEGAYLRDTESHRQFGRYWCSLHELCRWGGEWGDGNHYSVTDRGRR